MTTKTELKSTTAIVPPKSNSGGLVAFGDDMLAQAQLAGQIKTGAMWHAVEHANVWRSLLPSLEAKDAKQRDILLTFWRENTPAGQAFHKRFEALKAEEDRTPEQAAEFANKQGVLKAVNSNLVRAVDTFKGMEHLKRLGRKVNVRKVPNTEKTYACYVIYTDNPSLKPNEQEEDKVSFNVGALINVNHIVSKIKPDMSTLDIRKLASAYRETVPGVQPGGAVEVDRSKLGEMAKVMDTALTGCIKEGKIEGVSTETRDNMLAVWARLDFELSKEEKDRARQAFAKLAAPIAEKVPNVVEKVKAAIKKTA